MAGRFSVEAVFKAVDRITAPVTRMQNRVGKFTRSVEAGLRRANRAMGKFTAGIKKGARVAAASFVIAAAAMTPVVTAGAAFEQAITDVGAVSLQTRKDIFLLEEQALSLGRSTKFTATQAANAMEVLARAGFSVNDILKATPAVLSAAAASGLEIAEVANHVSNVLKGMGLATSDAARVADVLALASSRTNSSIGSLGESMKNVASTARSLNVPLEQVVASVALLQDVGLDASVAGSALNTMLTKMAAPTVAMQRKMRRFGISFKDAKGDMLPLAKVLENLSIASKKAGGNFDKVAFLAELVGLRGQKAASNLAVLFETGKLEKLVKELDKAKGVADKMAALRMDTFEGSMFLLGSAVDAVKVKIFNMNSGPLRDTVDRMTAWVSANDDLIATKVSQFLSDLIEKLPTIALWAERIGKALLVFFAVSAAVNVATVAMAAFNLVMMANPFVLAAIAIAGLVVFADDLLVAFGKMPKIFQLAFAPIWGVLKAIQGIKTGLNFIGGKLGGALFDLFGPDAGGADDASAGPVPQVVSPQERVARSVEEQRTTSTAEVTLRTEPGTRAEVTGGKLGTGLKLQQTGAF